MCETVAGTEPPTTAPVPTMPPKIPCSDSDDTWIRMPGDEDYCYAFFNSYNEDLSWTKAEANCTHMGGHLASIHSLEENDFIMVEVS